jgi:hypothetical protein
MKRLASVFLFRVSIVIVPIVIVSIVIVSIIGLALCQTAACQVGWAKGEAGVRASIHMVAAPQDDVPELVIQSESELPDTFPNAAYEFRFHARGGVPVLHWRVEKRGADGHALGALPPGMKLEDNGLLHGQAERTGEFQFTVSVRDGGNPQQAVQKGFVLRVRSALVIQWKSPAHVNVNRIEGSVAVTNATPDDMELTFDVKAVAENGRATEIGYQHFVLHRGTIAMALPFGDTLPHGGYVVHVNAVGEIAAKNLIYREQMQAPRPLQVTVGP